MRALARTVRAALRGAPRDYTEGDPREAIILLAVPMVMEMAMESVFAITDVFWVSRLGKEAVAVVGVTESMMTIIYALAIGLSMAATAVVARRTGEKDLDGAARAAVQVLAVGVLVASLIGAVGIVYGADLLALMGAEPAVVAEGGTFARIMLGGNATVLLLFLANAIFRGAGDAALAMRSLWLANGLNIVLDPCFIYGWGPFPAMGVTGAAVATNVGRGCGVIYQLVALARGRAGLRVGRRHLALDLPVLGNVVRIASTGAAQMLVATTSWVGLVRILAGFGSAALAGYTLGLRVILFALLPSWGLANAAATLVGQNLGAGRPDRAEQAVWTAARWNLYFLTGVGVVFVVLAGPIVSIFDPEPAVRDFAIRSLWIVALGFPLYAYGMVVTAALNGAGDTRTPTLINLGCFWLFEIPLAWALAVPGGLGPTGVFVAITAAFSALAVVGVGVFRRGRWRTVRT